MPSYEKKIGDRRIVDSGTIVTDVKDNSVELSLGPLTFKLFFEISNENPSINNEIEGGAANLVLNLKLKGVDRIIGGVGWHSEVGTFENNKLFLSLHILSVGSDEKFQRSINYTFSSGS